MKNMRKFAWMLFFCLLLCGCNSTTLPETMPLETTATESFVEEELLVPTEPLKEYVNATWEIIEDDCPVELQACQVYRMGDGRVYIQLEYQAPAGLMLKIQDSQTGIFAVGEGNKPTVDGKNKAIFELDETLFDVLRSFRIMFSEETTAWTLEVSCSASEDIQPVETQDSIPMDFQKDMHYAKTIHIGEERIFYRVLEDSVHFTVQFSADNDGYLCVASIEDLFKSHITETVEGENIYEFDIPLDSYDQLIQGRWIVFSIWKNAYDGMLLLFAPQVLQEVGTALCEAVSLPFDIIYDEAKTVSVEQVHITAQPISNGSILYHISFEANGNYSANFFDWPNGDILRQPQHYTADGLNEYELVLPLDVAKCIEQFASSIILNEERYKADRIFLTISDHSKMIGSRFWAQEYPERFEIAVVCE